MPTVFHSQFQNPSVSFWVCVVPDKSYQLLTFFLFMIFVRKKETTNSAKEAYVYSTCIWNEKWKI